MTTTRILARLAPSVVLAAAALWATDADASGLSTARFGGEHGHPTGTNATTIYYNPGAIALMKGTHIHVDGLIALRSAQYTRGADAVNLNPGQDAMEEALSLSAAPGANNGTANLFNVAGAPFIGVTSDFGTEFIYGGLAAYVPFGGGAKWGKNDTYKNSADFGGAYDGVQRWYAIDGNLRSFYITGALAFKIKEAANLTIGFSGSAIYTSFDTIRARNADGTDNLVTGMPGDYTIKEGRSWLVAKGWTGGFAAGFTVEPVKEVLWIGGSYTSQPAVAGGMSLKGTLTNIFANAAEPAVTNIELTQSYPDIVRLGFRVRPIPKLELRVFADYSRWSVMDKQCVMIVKTDPSNDSSRKCNFPGAENALTDPSSFGAPSTDPDQKDVVDVTQHLPRFWKDAGGVRLGVGYWFVPQLETYLGFGYDSSAIPVQTVDPALFDMDKITVTAGVLWQAHKRVALGATVGQVVYLTIDTKGRNVFNQFTSPTKQASADGIYKQWLTLGNLYLDISF